MLIKHFLIIVGKIKIKDRTMARGYNLNRYRNFGIIAHIDAGKTTTQREFFIILESLIK